MRCSNGVVKLESIDFKRKITHIYSIIGKLIMCIRLRLTYCRKIQFSLDFKGFLGILEIQ
jgi:hypothetical protein